MDTASLKSSRLASPAGKEIFRPNIRVNRAKEHSANKKTWFAKLLHILLRHHWRKSRICDVYGVIDKQTSSHDSEDVLARHLVRDGLSTLRTAIRCHQQEPPESLFATIRYKEVLVAIMKVVRASNHNQLTHMEFIVTRCRLANAGFPLFVG